jgi:ribonuclease HII
MRGANHIAGVDEVGRGPLAGPVVAACVILPIGFECGLIDDSKKLTEKKREAAFAVLMACTGIRYGIGCAESSEIDKINILRATHLAMRRAIAQVGEPIDVILLDGLPVRNLSRHSQQAIVGGDAKSISIAAASIIAKVTRDRRMIDYDRIYPGYGFAGHKGYCAATHLESLSMLGPCPIHRRSFAPVAASARNAILEEGPTDIAATQHDQQLAFSIS